MTRKCFHFIKRYRNYLLFLILYVAFYVFKGTLQPAVVTVTNEQTYTVRNIRSSTYPILSVIAINSTDDALYDVFAVNTWIHQTANQVAEFCCYIMTGGVVETKPIRNHNQRREMFKYTAQVECPNPETLVEPISSHLLGISISVNGICTDKNEFVKPFYPLKQTEEFSFAVCGKLIFGDIDIALTTEWMEYNKYMGVSKVVLYSYNISSKVSTLLQFYQSIGFVDVIPFNPPPGDSDSHRPGEKTLAAWNDEQLLVYDCQSRLRGFKYVAVIDLDEFIVPIVDRNFRNMMDRLMYALPNMAAAEVYSEMYVLDWGKTNTDGALVISQYQNRTVSKVPNIDINQRKLIHLPARIQMGSVITHGCKPLNVSFQIFKDPMSLLGINHYRRCVNYRKGCLIRKRVTDNRIVRFLKHVERAVYDTKQKLNFLQRDV